MAQDGEELVSTTEQAAFWWTVFSDGEASPGERRQFVDWVTRGAEQVAAVIRVARVQSALARSNVRWPDEPREELIAQASASPHETVIPLYASGISAAVRPRHPRPLGIALGLAALLVIGMGVGWFVVSRPETFQTRLGEERSVMLSDGSRITLNTASKVEVRLQSHRRQLKLVQGEALFEVAHDAQRPFEVAAGEVVVRDVGTEFDVERLAAQTVVTVVEGRVEILASGNRRADLPFLAATDRVVVDGTGSAKLEHGVRAADVTAWTQGLLVFRWRPLAEIAKEFGRYSAQRVEIRSPALRNQQVTGTFKSSDLASFVAVLESLPGVHVSLDKAGNYIVTSDAPLPLQQ